MVPSLELLGRKKTVIISDIIFTIGAVLCTVPNDQLGLMYAGRLLTGLGVGGIAAVCPIYIAEVCFMLIIPIPMSAHFTDVSVNRFLHLQSAVA
jgi:MFS family permease